MTATDGPFECVTCDAAVQFEEARHTKTMGGLDPTTWQILCCPRCGFRPKTVYIGDRSVARTVDRSTLDSGARDR